MGVDRFGFYLVSRLCRGPLRGLFKALVSYAQGLARRKLRRFATNARIARPLYRNFFTPERNDVIAGFRTCAL